MDYVSIVTLAIPWQSFECAAGVDVFAKLVIISALPLVLLLVCCLVFLLPLHWKDQQDMSDVSTMRDRRQRARGEGRKKPRISQNLNIFFE